jgi:hypothetical protein
MLIDTLLPHCDFYERHSIVVRATPDRAFAAIESADLAGSAVVRLLLTLRGMGRKPKRTTLRFADGFRVAAEDPPREIVLALEGPFWNPRCRPRGIDAESFGRPVPPNTARAAWNFVVEKVDDVHTRVTTETRVLCSDDARRKFALYWFLIRPGSGLIRRMMLRAIRAEAVR